MIIVFKTFLNKKNGTGHFFRCLNFAKFLINKYNNKIIFITNKIDKKFKKILDSSKIKNKQINSFEDFYKNLKKIKKINFLILDDLSIDKTKERKIIDLGIKLCVIEDGYKKHLSNIIINPNYVNKNRLKKNNLLTKRFFIGPNYALNLNKKKINISKKNKKVLIYMGGSDKKNYTSKIVKSLNFPEFSNIDFTILKGVINKKIDKISKLKNKKIKIKIINHKKKFEKILENYEFCITSGGSSIWQMLFAGMKILVINQNLKQSYNSKILNNKNFIKLFQKKITIKNLRYFFYKYIKKKNLNFKKFIFSDIGINQIAREINES